VPADAGDVVPSGARRGLEPPCARGTGRLAFGAERLAVHSGLAGMLGVARVRAAVAAGTVRLASTEHCLSGRDPPAVSERLQPGGVHFHQWEQQPRGRMEYHSDVGRRLHLYALVLVDQQPVDPDRQRRLRWRRRLLLRLGCEQVLPISLASLQYVAEHSWGALRDNPHMTAGGSAGGCTRTSTFPHEVG